MVFGGDLEHKHFTRSDAEEANIAAVCTQVQKDLPITVLYSYGYLNRYISDDNQSKLLSLVH